ncbi:hypothetical protein Zmor_007464 [Zophobas morio]|uniref:Uncharacterized protein n=1 Tax=Zophobas morio TaxID=2755281 RepID=A0AA38MPM2_9CUCU|nr:hypothetical protein Zmor_007464 [Zophobas morio]
MTLYKNQTIFPDKLRNMKRYHLRVSLFVDFPLTVKNPPGKWVGNDYELLQVVTSMMNATFEIIEPEGKIGYFGAYDDIMANKTDFCFITHFYMCNLFQEADYTYPHEMSRLVAVVPTRRNTGRNMSTIFSIFRFVVWILCLVVLVLVSLLSRPTLKNPPQPFQRLFFYVLQAFLGNAFPGLDSKPFPVKLQLVIFIFSCIIFRTAFQCFLISSFVKPSRLEQIDTITQLRESKIKVYTSGALAKMIPLEFGISEQIDVITPVERINMLYGLNTKGAYIIGGPFADKFVGGLKGDKEHLPFRIMKDILVPGVSVYFFQTHSPFVDKISECIQREKQFALSTRKRRYKRNLRRNNDEGDLVVLEIGHLHSIFYVWMGGLVLSCLCLVFECIYSKYNIVF